MCTNGLPSSTDKVFAPYSRAQSSQLRSSHAADGRTTHKFLANYSVSNQISYRVIVFSNRFHFKPIRQICAEMISNLDLASGRIILHLSKCNDYSVAYIV